MNATYEAPIPRSFLRIVGGLSAVNVAIAALGLLTGPLQARALGPEGRGDLAAVMVPLTLAPVLLMFGLGAFAAREAARGGRRGTIIGSTGASLLAVGLLAAVAAPAVSDALARGRPDVERMLLLGLILTPFALLGILLGAIAGGMEEWGRVMQARLIAGGGSAASIVVLYIADRLTVESAVLTSLTFGLLSLVPTVVAFRGAGRIRMDLALTGAAWSYGLRVWPGSLAALANVRLDQLLMVALVSSRDLGIYVVAVTFASIPSFLTSAVGPVIFTRMANGRPDALARAHRVVVLVGLVSLIVLGGSSPFIVGALFGSEFREGALSATILLAAGIPQASAVVLGSALAGAGYPGRSTVGELATVSVTIAGLVVLLPVFGIVAAAVVSFIAYGLNALYLTFATRQLLNVPILHLVSVRPSDVHLLTAALRNMRSRRS